jgi:hypothetical protein
MHPSELPYVQRDDWTQDETITYLVQNVFGVPRRVRGGKGVNGGGRAGGAGGAGGQGGGASFVRVESGFVGVAGSMGTAGTGTGLGVATASGSPSGGVGGGGGRTGDPARAPTTATATAPVYTYLPRGYRIPLMFVAKFQWESLRLVLTSERPEGEWGEFR